MTVFKGYLTIIRRNLGLVIMYIVIFMAMTVIIGRATADSVQSQGFTSVRAKVAVIDRDQGLLGETLRQVMERDQTLVELEDDPQVIQEELYYENVVYVVIVPEKAGERLEDGELSVESVTAPGSAVGYYLDAQINNLLNQIRVYLAAGFSGEEACERAVALGETRGEVELVNLNGNQGKRENYNYYFAYLPYAFLSSATMCMGQVSMEFKKRELRRRMQSSAVPFYWQNLSAVGAFCLVGFLIWSFCLLVQAALYGGGIFVSQNRGYYLLNSGACMVVSLAVGYLGGTLSNSPSSLSGVNNVFSLGFCFLGGVFVPLEMFGGGIRRAAQFLPTYWYSRINGILGDYGSLNGENMGVIWKGLLIQAVFALACFSVTLAIRRVQLQEKN